MATLSANERSKKNPFFILGFRLFFFSLKKYLSSKTKSGIRTWIFLICFALLFFTSDYLLSLTSFYITIALFVSLTVLYALFAFPFDIFSRKNAYLTPKEKLHKFIDFPFLFVVFFCALTLVSFTANRQTGTFYGYLGIMMYIVAGYLFTSCFCFHEFVKAYTKFFPLLCFFSLLFFATIQVSGAFPSTFIYYDSVTTKYSWFFLQGFLQYYSNKNQGIFWEPGIFASFILLGIILETCFKEGRINKASLIIEIITLLTTRSLAGYILAFPVGLIIFVKRHPNKKSQSIVTIFWFVTMVLIASYPFVGSYVVGLFPILSAKGESLTTRVYSLIVDLELWVKNPFFGIGTARFYQLVPELISTQYAGIIDSSVSTTGYYLVVLGTAGLMLFLAFVASFLCLKRLNWATRIGLVFVAFLITNKEPHINDTITWTLLFYAIEEGLNKQLFKWNNRFSGFGINSLLSFERGQDKEESSAREKMEIIIHEIKI